MALLDEVMRSKRPGMATAANETNQYQLMQTVAAQPQAKAQQLGAAMASAAGQEQLKQTQAVIQEKTAGMEQQLTREQMQVRELASQKDIAYRKLAEKNAQRIYDLDKSAGYQINEANRQFKLDEAGRKYLNDKQLDLYMVNKAESQEQLKDYAAKMELAYKRKAMLMDTYAKKLAQAIQQGYAVEQQELDQATREKIAIMQANFLKEKENALKRARERAMRSSLIVQGMGVVGGVVGGFITKTPVGVAAGSAAGTGLGMAYLQASGANQGY